MNVLRFAVPLSLFVAGLLLLFGVGIGDGTSLEPYRMRMAWILLGLSVVTLAGVTYFKFWVE